MCWTRESVPPQRDRAQACLSTLNASAGHELDNAALGMSMRYVVFKSRVATGRGLEVEWEVVVWDAGGRICGTRCGSTMFEGSRPMYTTGAKRHRKRHVHPMSSFVVVTGER